MCGDIRSGCISASELAGTRPRIPGHEDSQGSATGDGVKISAFEKLPAVLQVFNLMLNLLT